jgi:hypothetical protein
MKWLEHSITRRPRDGLLDCAEDRLTAIVQYFETNLVAVVQIRRHRTAGVELLQNASLGDTTRSTRAFAACDGTPTDD